MNKLLLSFTSILTDHKMGLSNQIHRNQRSYPGASQAVLVVKNLPANAGDIRGVDLIPGSGRSPGEVNGNPLQYAPLENPMDREAWWLQFIGSQRVGHD